MWAVEWYLAVVEYVGCCMVCGVLNGMWAFVGNVGCCMVCFLLYGMWAVEWYVGC